MDRRCFFYRKSKRILCDRNFFCKFLHGKFSIKTYLFAIGNRILKAKMKASTDTKRHMCYMCMMCTQDQIYNFTILKIRVAG